MYIMIGGEKGGSGKTTIAVNLAIETALLGHRVLLVDGDAQGSSMKYIERRKNTVPDRASPDAVHLKAHDLVKGLQAKAGDYDHVFLDFAGRDSEEFRIGCGFVDVVLTPLRPTMLDLETVDKVDTVIGKFGANNKNLKRALIVLTQVTTHAAKRLSVIADAEAFLADLKRMDVARTHICTRSGYENAAFPGLAVTETLAGEMTKDAGASKEIKALFDEVMRAGKSQATSSELVSEVA